MVGSFTIHDKEYFLTPHAIYRAEKRKITIEELKDALTNYKRFSRNFSSFKKGSFYILGKNNIVIVLCPQKITIITVMRKNKEHSKSIHRSKKNKSSVMRKRKYGNRAKK